MPTEIAGDTQLIAEIARLRARVAELEQQIEQSATPPEPPSAYHDFLYTSLETLPDAASVLRLEHDPATNLPDFQLVYANDVFCNNFLQNAETVANETALQLLNSDMVDSIAACAERLKSNRGHCHFVHELSSNPPRFYRMVVVSMQDDLFAVLGTDITIFMSVEDDLEDLSLLHRVTVQDMAVGILIEDEQGLVTYVNQAACDMLGYAAEELIGQSWTKIVLPDQQPVVDALDALRADGISNRYEVDLKAKDGSRRTVLVSGCPWVENGEFTGSVAMFVDISSHREAENALRLAHIQAETVNRLIPSAVITIDSDQRMTSASDLAVNLTGYARDELLGQPLGMLFPGLDEDFPARDIDDRGLAFDIEVSLRTKDGLRLIVSKNIAVQREPDGTFAGAILSFEDISERKRLEAIEREQFVWAEALRDTVSAVNSTLSFDEVLDRVLVGISRVLQHDAAVVMLLDGDEMRVVRYDGAHPASAPASDVTNVAFSITDTPTIATLMKTKQSLVVPDSYAYAGWVILPEVPWIRSHISAPIIVDGEIMGLAAVDSAIPNFYGSLEAGRLQTFADQVAMALKNARLHEQLRNNVEDLESIVHQRTFELRVAKEQIETILNSSSDMIALINLEGIISQANATFERVFDIPRESLRGRSVAAFVSDDYADLLFQTLKAVSLSRVAQHIEITVCSASQFPLQVEMALAPVVSGPDMTVTGLVCSLRDISQRKRVEQEMRLMLEREMELNRVKSHFIETVSHEFRTPLAVVQSASELLARYHDAMTPEGRERQVSNIIRGIKRMVELLDDVFHASYVDADMWRLTPDRFDFIQFCESIVAEMEAGMAPHAPVVFTHSEESVEVVLDRALVRQVIVAVLDNAIKFSSADKLVTLDVRLDTEQVTITITDCGIGIPEADQAHLFELFHRGNNVGVISGTGLGLVIAKRAVDLHGGVISVDSRLGEGTRVHVTLPFVHSAHDHEPSSQ